MSEQIEDRLQTIRDIWAEYPALYLIGGFMLGLLFFPLLHRLSTDAVALLENLVPEAIGMAVTVFFIDSLYRRREEQREYHELTQRLIREAGSPDNATCLNAIREMRARGWITGDKSLLQNLQLISANLRNANLYQANLRGAVLTGCDLREANLFQADLTDAKLRKTNMQRLNLRGVRLIRAKMENADLSETRLAEADLTDAVVRGAVLHKTYAPYARFTGAYMTGATLTDAFLKGADFTGADLREVDFTGAKMEGAVMAEVKCDRKTRLPDGTSWFYGVDWSQFGAVDNAETLQSAGLERP
ncbi:MAG: hypothetical protein OHK0046_08370 [Anaerolineae bacterium]